MSLFMALVQISSNTVDAVMGERIRITPWTEAVYSAGSVDTARPVADVTGAYRETDKQKRITNSAPEGRDFERRFVTPKIWFSVRASELKGVEYRQGDRITRLELPGLPEFTISLIEPLDDGRLAISVQTLEPAA
ncbi:hypothetical protein [Bradyrhizobium sp. SZCCHNS1012]|uniref:hypothetical protein n=1 Tax=Bradyrhizobium sp. SZCCHNS1012 TaxID=3057297 RepID=UPI002916342E|nr:hypothetical protein [Bradyrhizobium sp. SZCCHNS1012]